MKKVFALALLVVGMTTFAQENATRKNGKENLTSEQKVDIQVKKMTKGLDLTEKQVKEVRTLVTEQIGKRESKRAALKKEKTKARNEMKAQMETNQVTVSAEMKRILTAEQFSKWENNRDERKEKMKEKMAERREKKELKEVPESK